MLMETKLSITTDNMPLRVKGCVNFDSSNLSALTITISCAFVNKYGCSGPMQPIVSEIDCYTGTYFRYVTAYGCNCFTSCPATPPFFKRSGEGHFHDLFENRNSDDETASEKRGTEAASATCTPRLW